MSVKFGEDNGSNRDAWVREQLSLIPAGNKLLDAGAGELRYKPYCSHLQYVSQDFCQYDGTGDGKGLQMQTWDTARIDIVSDILHIPEPDETFDAILCTEVLEHIPKPEEAIREFSRLLSSNGILILTAPFCSLTHFAPYHYFTGFNRYWYENVLRDDFEDITIIPNGNYFSYMAQELYRVDSMGKRYSQKGLGLIGRIAKKVLLHILQSMSLSDTGSSEVLCFGYHVTARKKEK
ncbi:MAG: class I SAM-dependent methyltransferase [Schwartzia sp.]|nr:class I SAM-dependent methyltransferase [Schwartzia sp. (in: firmicutes)]